MMNIFENEKFQKLVICVACFIVMITALFAIHDTVTATGAGYLFYLKTGVLSRSAWDIIADILVIVPSTLMLLVPAMICKPGIDVTALFFMANVSLTYLVRPDVLITSFMGREGIGITASVHELLLYLPTLLIAFAVVTFIRIASDEEDMLSLKKVCYFLIPAFFLIMSVTMSFMYEVFVFCAGYCVLLPIAARLRHIKEGKMILGAVLFVSALWRLYFVLATY